MRRDKKGRTRLIGCVLLVYLGFLFLAHREKVQRNEKIHSQENYEQVMDDYDLSNNRTLELDELGELVDKNNISENPKTIMNDYDSNRNRKVELDELGVIVNDYGVMGREEWQTD